MKLFHIVFTQIKLAFQLDSVFHELAISVMLIKLWDALDFDHVSISALGVICSLFWLFSSISCQEKYQESRKDNSKKSSSIFTFGLIFGLVEDGTN